MHGSPENDNGKYPVITRGGGLLPFELTPPTKLHSFYKPIHPNKGSIMIAITTKYLAATNHRPSRVVAYGHDAKQSATVNYNSHDNPHRAAAIELCRKMDWHGELCEGGTKDGQVLVFLDPQQTFTV
jgi:hypothetical protein